MSRKVGKVPSRPTRAGLSAACLGTHLVLEFRGLAVEKSTELESRLVEAAMLSSQRREMG